MATSKEDKIFYDLQVEYEKIFDDWFYIPMPSGFCRDTKIRFGIDENNFDDVEVGIAIMHKCIKTGKPYDYAEYDLPEGCIA